MIINQGGKLFVFFTKARKGNICYHFLSTPSLATKQTVLMFFESNELTWLLLEEKHVVIWLYPQIKKYNLIQS